MPVPSRRAPIEVFTRHHLSESVAEAVRALDVAIRQRTINDPREFGAFLDGESGEQRGEIIAGTRTRQEVDPLLCQMLPDRRYVCVHAHPEGDAFSIHDVALMLRFRAVCVIAAVGKRGQWHVLSVGPDQASPSVQAIAATLNQAMAEVLPHYERLVQDGAMG